MIASFDGKFHFSIVHGVEIYNQMLKQHTLLHNTKMLKLKTSFIQLDTSTLIIEDTFLFFSVMIKPQNRTGPFGRILSVC